MIYNKIVLVDRDTIDINREGRARKKLDPDHISTLGKQIKNQGLIHPILLESGTGRLIAGENRLMAFELLAMQKAECPFGYEDWQKIPARLAKNPTETEVAVLELSENIGHKKMVWQDVAAAVKKIADMFQVENEDLSIAELCNTLGHSYSFFQQNLAVAKYLDDPEIAKCTSRGTAYNIIQRRLERQIHGIVEDITYETRNTKESELRADNSGTGSTGDETPVSVAGSGNSSDREGSSVSEAVVFDTPKSGGTERNFLAQALSFLDWAPGYSGPRFNFLHCDFPYGVNLHKSSTMQKSGRAQYEDTEEIFNALLGCLVEHQDRFISDSAHILFWHSAEDRELVSTRLKDAGWRVWLYPIIWHKSCNTGLFPDSRRGPRHTYEMATLASRGDRKIVKLVADSFSGAAVKNSGHESEKPQEMLMHFFRMLVDESTTVLDPTGGSGNALHVAKALGAQRGLMLEINDHYVHAFNRSQQNG